MQHSNRHHHILKLALGACLLGPTIALAAFTFPPFGGGGDNESTPTPSSQVSNALVICTLPQGDSSSSCSSSGSTSSSCTSGDVAIPSLVSQVDTSTNTPSDTEDDLKSRVGDPCMDVIDTIENTYSGKCDFSANGVKLYYQCTLK